MMRLPRQIRDAVVAHARFCAPLEACGVLAVDDRGELRMAYCLTNIDRSRRRFTVDPQEHYHAIRHAERHGWSIGGAFHSHPVAKPMPSARDLAGAADPGWVHLIVGPVAAPEVRAFRILRNAATELTIDVV